MSVYTLTLADNNGVSFKTVVMLYFCTV